MDADEILARIRTAREHVLEQEKQERARIAEAETTEQQSAASVRLATRQAVREALDDILGEDRDSAMLEYGFHVHPVTIWPRTGPAGRVQAPAPPA